MMSINVVDLIKRHEGFRSEMYTDTTGHSTIGYGFNLEAIKLPRAVAELWLAFELEKLQDKLNDYNWFNDLDHERQAVITDMAYNLGLAGLLEFKQMIEALRNNNYDKASIEMLDSRWATQVGRRATELSGIMRGDRDNGI